LYIADTLGNAVWSIANPSTCTSVANCNKMLVTSNGLLNAPIGLCRAPSGNIITPQARCLLCVLSVRCPACPVRCACPVPCMCAK
jgi:hypothetical protein